MGKKPMKQKSLPSNNLSKNKDENNVNSIAKKVSLSFETADDLLMNKDALNKDSLRYASEIKNRLG
ncbi:MAG: hypothetical protein ACOX4H_02145 [Bacillota bacterium]|jgi:hypothetical protein|nr:hypothetical protein [Clostridia bacterium]